ncbi:MAG: hypothetical protein RSA02_04535, partial [Bacteroidales bacterium]
VLMHEAGHIYFDTVDNEVLADRYSLSVLAGTEKESLRNNLERMTSILEAAGASELRLKELIRSSLFIDYIHFNNLSAKDLLDEIDGRKAQVFGISAILAITAMAISVATTAAQMGMQKRANWFIGDANGTTRNGYKEELIRCAVQEYVAETLRYNYALGEDYILATLSNKSDNYSAVYGKLRNYFTDTNWFSRSFGNMSNFYKNKNCGWAKVVIDAEIEKKKYWVHTKLVEAGYVSDKKNSSIGIKNTTGVLLIVAALVVSLFLILKKKA